MKKGIVVFLILGMVLAGGLFGDGSQAEEEEITEITGIMDTDGSSFWLETDAKKSFDIHFEGRYQKKMLKKLTFSKKNRDEGTTLKGIIKNINGRQSLDISSIYKEAKKYDDARIVIEAFTEITICYIKGLDSATTANAVATALNTYCDDLEPMIPKMKAIEKKYSKEIKGKEPPPELKPALDKFKKAFSQLFNVTSKVMKHGNDLAVKEANERYKQLMSQMK